jgi:predicted ester cyclase
MNTHLHLLETTELNKETYRHFIDEIFNCGRFERLNEFLTADYVLHDAPPGTAPGRDGIRQVVTMLRSAFPDLKVSVDAQIAEDDRVCSMATTTGTHTGGPIFGIRPTGRQVIMKGMTVARIANGRVAESWVKNDVLGLMTQLGAESRSWRPSVGRRINRVRESAR